jgi:hypothetical protein
VESRVEEEWGWFSAAWAVVGEDCGGCAVARNLRREVARGEEERGEEKRSQVRGLPDARQGPASVAGKRSYGAMEKVALDPLMDALMRLITFM